MSIFSALVLLFAYSLTYTLQTHLAFRIVRVTEHVSMFVCRMADWLKKQSDREAEKEQRRLERIQRKLAEPKHYFTDPDYERQCHDLSERLEDSVLKGNLDSFSMHKLFK